VKSARSSRPDAGGQFKDGDRQVAWKGHFRDYATVQGLRVPRHGEVGWYDDGVWQRVWEGTIMDAAYE
jgi:hypothetical protein